MRERDSKGYCEADDQMEREREREERAEMARERDLLMSWRRMMLGDYNHESPQNQVILRAFCIWVSAEG